MHLIFPSARAGWSLPRGEPGYGPALCVRAGTLLSHQKTHIFLLFFPSKSTSSPRQNVNSSPKSCCFSEEWHLPAKKSDFFAPKFTFLPLRGAASPHKKRVYSEKWLFSKKSGFSPPKKNFFSPQKATFLPPKGTCLQKNNFSSPESLLSPPN